MLYSKGEVATTMAELVAKRCIGKASRRNLACLEANAARSADHEVFPTFWIECLG